ncbi:Wzt carbohydrate-binding domain-containing protein [Paenibacillus sp. Marseille-Q7038]
MKKDNNEDITSNSDNPEEYRYGDLSAEIIEVLCIDEMNKESNWIVYTLDDFKIRIKILFYEDCKNPVLGFYIKNKKGLEMYSGNTHYMNKNIGSASKGQIVEVHLRKKWFLLQMNMYYLLVCQIIMRE